MKTKDKLYSIVNIETGDLWCSGKGRYFYTSPGRAKAAFRDSPVWRRGHRENYELHTFSLSFEDKGGME